MLFTIDAVAKALNLNPRTIRRYIEKGQLPAQKIGGSWRISYEDVESVFGASALGQIAQKLSVDMHDLYMQGKHPLQEGGKLACMFVMIFHPEQQPWILAKIHEWIALLNRHGTNPLFEFTMTSSDATTMRLTLIGSLATIATMTAELERLRTM